MLSYAVPGLWCIHELAKRVNLNRQLAALAAVASARISAAKAPTATSNGSEPTAILACAITARCDARSAQQLRLLCEQDPDGSPSFALNEPHRERVEAQKRQLASSTSAANTAAGSQSKLGKRKATGTPSDDEMSGESDGASEQDDAGEEDVAEEDGDEGEEEEEGELDVRVAEEDGESDGEVSLADEDPPGGEELGDGEDISAPLTAFQTCTPALHAAVSALSSGLNESQKRAVEAATTRSHPHPGTSGHGKDARVSGRLDSLGTRAEPRGGPFLAASDSNIAVDNLLEGLARRGVRVVRLGRPDSVREDLQRFMPPFVGLNPQQAAQALKEAVRRADVVCCTTMHAGAASVRNVGALFRAVLIDEATQATEASTVVALCRGCRQLVMVGDQCQLPPTVLSRCDDESLDASLPLFTRLVLDGVHPLLLDVQYRDAPRHLRAAYRPLLCGAPAEWHRRPRPDAATRLPLAASRLARLFHLRRRRREPRRHLVSQ